MKRNLTWLLLLSLYISCAQQTSKNGAASMGTQMKSSDQVKSVAGGSDIFIDVKKKVLSNGMRILVVENDRLPIFSYYTFYDIGGRYEEKGTTGATHFLEHLMFKGSKNYPSGQFNSLIEGNGGNSNAYTSIDNTVYYESLPSEFLELMIDLEVDRMQHLVIDPVAFEKERKVIFEERKMRLENSSGGKLYYKMMEEVFKGTPYGGSVIGTKEDLKSLSREQVFNFYKRFYTPSNTTIVIVGDVKARKIFSILEKKMGHIPRNIELDKYKKSKDDPKKYTHRAKYKKHFYLHGENPNPMFMMAYKGVRLGERKSFVIDLLSAILGYGESSYLNKKYVVNKKPILNNISAAHYSLVHNGVFFLSGELRSGISQKSIKNKLTKSLRASCKKSINPRSLQKAKNQFLIDYYSDIQTNKGTAHFIGNREYYYNDYNFYKKEMEIYNSIEIDEVKKVCRSMFAKGENIFLSIWNKNKKARK
jgi:zinc protease